MTNDRDKKLGDMLRKVVNTGIGAAFLTEEAIKEKLGDIPLPKDFVSGLLQNAKQQRDDFIGTVKTEIKSYLGAVDVTKEISNIVENYDVEVNAKFSFSPKKKTKSSSKSSEKKKN